MLGDISPDPGAYLTRATVAESREDRDKCVHYATL